MARRKIAGEREPQRHDGGPAEPRSQSHKWNLGRVGPHTQGSPRLELSRLRRCSTLREHLSGEAPLTESELIRRARQGDPAAWEELVRLHQEAAFRLAYLILGDRAEAEDAAQEAFLNAFRSLGRFDAARPFRPWLMRIAANQARNRRRSIGRQWARLQRMAREDPETIHATRSPLPEAAQAEDLWRAVRKLSPDDQEVIYLRYFLALSEMEAAEVMNVAVGTAKSRLHRGLGRLREIVVREFPALREALTE